MQTTLLGIRPLRQIRNRELDRYGTVDPGNAYNNGLISEVLASKIFEKAKLYMRLSDTNIVHQGLLI